MNALQNDIIKTKKMYEELFFKAKDAIDIHLNALKTASLCNKCKENCDIDFNEIDLFQSFPVDCRYRYWQESALNHLVDKISKDVFFKIQEIDQVRCKYNCACCSSCCKLASSEFSYQELKDRAQNGDKFSAEFVSVFVPYDNIEQARAIYPDYVNLVEKELGDSSKVYFYYCPKLGEDGLCSDYENRPDICRVFPSNPLVSLPLKCSFNRWKDEVEISALTLNALVDIIGFYKEKLESLLQNQ